MTEFKVRLKDGRNPDGDMGEILKQAKQKLNGEARDGLRVSFEPDKDEVVIKIKPI